MSLQDLADYAEGIFQELLQASEGRPGPVPSLNKEIERRASGARARMTGFLSVAAG